tara:strand:- start:5468 stop:5749 length:282 start_codon:yes stop_codon:yes gene_type:complete
MQRITIKDLRAVCARLNRITGSPDTYSSNKPGEPFKANIGNYHISQAYGGYCLHRVHNTGGGVSAPLSSGHIPARELYNLMQAYISGLNEVQA